MLWVDWVVRGGMFLLMFGMGLALTRDDFARVFAYPRATVVGTAVQLVAMPLAGLALAVGSGLPALYAAGLLICAACPGGTMSNMVVHLGRADTALSITLTATATLATLVTLPFWVNGLFAILGGESAALHVPVVETALELGSFTILPVLLGMRVRGRLADPAAWEKRLTRGGAAGVVFGLTVKALSEDSETFAGAAAAIGPVAALLVIAAVLGYALPLLLRVPPRESATVGVEVVLKNTVLGIVLAEQSLGLEAAVPLAMYMTFHLPVSIGIIASYRVWERRQCPGGAPAPETSPPA